LDGAGESIAEGLVEDGEKWRNLGVEGCFGVDYGSGWHQKGRDYEMGGSDGQIRPVKKNKKSIDF
jgi:hypothetical protein